jgi:hypothetical protein
MRVTIYTPGRRRLLGTVEDTADGMDLVTYHEETLPGAEERISQLNALLDELDDLPRSDPELRAQAVLEALGDRAEAVPDAAHILNIWPGPDRGFLGKWLDFHPDCPNPPAGGRRSESFARPGPRGEPLSFP